MTAVTHLVDRERAHLRRQRLLGALAAAGGAAAAGLLVGALLFGQARWLALPRSLPALVALASVATVIAVGWRAYRWFGTGGTRRATATLIEREQGMRAGALSGVLELTDGSELARHADHLMSLRLEQFNGVLAPASRRDGKRRVARAAIVAAALSAGLVLIAPFHSDGLLAVLRPLRAWDGSLLPPLSFRAPPAVVMRGDTVRLEIVAPGRARASLHRRTPGEGWRTMPLLVGDSGVVTATVGPLEGEARFVVTDGRAWSDTVVIRVTDRPFVGGVAIRATYPAYLGMTSETLSADEPLMIPVGTVLDITGRVSSDLRDLRIRSGADSVALPVTGRTFAGRIAPRVSGSWAWVAGSTTSIAVDVPAPIQLDVVPDSLPRIEVTQPFADTVVLTSDRVVLRAVALDDHGLRDVSVVVRRTPSGAAVSAPETRSLAATRDPVWSGEVEIDVGAKGLQPGDAIRVSMVATDDSPWAQRSTSREVVFRVPSLEEQRALARAASDSTAASAAAMAAAERALERRTSEAARDRENRPADASSASSATASKPDLTYEGAERARLLAADQRALTEQAQELGRSARALEDQLRSAGALDSSIARQLQEAQALLREAVTPELLAEMLKLETSARQLSRERTQASLRDLQAMQQKLREQLEKSAELLRRAAIEGAMRTMADDARDLATQQQRLADTARRPAAAAWARQESARLAERSARLGLAMKGLEERLARETALSGSQKTGEAGMAVDRSAASLRAVATRFDSAAADMHRAAKAMDDARAAQIDEWKGQLTAELDRAIQELLQLSREEAGMAARIRGADSATVDVRGEQSAVKQGLDQAARRLQEEARRSSLLSNRSQRAVADAQGKVNEATALTTDRQLTRASASMNDAASALSRAAASLARDRQRANSSASATGFAEMLREMQEAANKQGSINAQAANLFALTPDQQTAASQATARALARQQRQLAQQLDELGDGPGAERAMKLAQEARLIADALDGGRLDAATIARQQQLFRRLLDAGRSLEQEERDESGRRESRAGGGGTLAPGATRGRGGAPAVRFREPTWDELRGLSAEERRIIIEYFRRINGGRGG
jgi:hypothetical protein